jgi:hypothetical protein
MNMKSSKAIRLVTTLSVFALLAILAPLVAAQGKQDFTLYNRTGMAISELYISPASEDEWGDDILGIDVLANNEDTLIHFSPRERVASWDIKLIDEYGKEHIRYKFNLLNISEITVTKQGDGSWYWTWK